jgi:hypothetical protein
MAPEVRYRLSSAACTFGKLRRGVWKERALERRTKIAVYRDTVLPALLYGAETWAVTQPFVKQLESFHAVPSDAVRRPLGRIRTKHRGVQAQPMSNR